MRLMTVMITLVVLSSPLAAQAPLNAGLIIAANTADAITTVQAFKRGGREANPLSADWPLPAILVSKGIFTAGFASAAVLLERRGHPRVAKVLTYLDLSGMVWVSWHNNKVGR